MRITKILLTLLAAAAVPALVLGLAAAGGVSAQDQANVVELSIEGGAADCDGNECVVGTGASFTVVVSVTQAPATGYLGIQTQVVFGSLIYAPTQQAVDEIVVDEDDFPGIAVRSPETTGRVSHGTTAGTPPNFTTSDYEGPVLNLAMTCTDQYTRNDVQLGRYTDQNTLGTAFEAPNGDNIAAGGGTLTVHCGTPPAGARGTPTPPSSSGEPTPGPGTPDLSSPEGQATATAIAEADQATATAEAGATATAAALEGNGGDDDDDDGGGNAVLWIVLGVVGGVIVLGGGGFFAWRWYGQRDGSGGPPGGGESSAGTP